MNANNVRSKKPLRPRARFDSPPHPTCDIMSFSLQEAPHMSIAFSRRAAILGAAALRMIRIVKAQPRPKFIAIAGANRNNGGVNACAKAIAVMRAGGDTLDAIIAGVNIVELDPRDNSVGFGDAPTNEQKHALVEDLRRDFPHVREAVPAQAVDHAYNAPRGAINCVGMNEKGEMSSVTTTSGVAWKIPGGCADSPIIGGGLCLDQDGGGAGSTGRGEENLRVAGARTIVENMRHGMSPKDAALDCLKRVARNFNNDEKRLAQVELSFYVLRKDGEYCAASLWKSDVPGFAVGTDGNARAERAVYLLERKG
jgi:hypothetical protein